MVETLPPLTYGKVIARYVAVVADTPEDVDKFPNAVPLQGTVTFTPQVDRLKVVNATPVPTTVVARPITATLDADGYLSRNGDRELWLVASNGPTDPTDFSYSVSFDLTLDGQPAPMASFYLMVPADATIDLTVVAEALPSPGTDLPVIGLPPGGTTGQVLGRTGASDYLVGWIDQTGGGGGGGGLTEQQVIDLITANARVSTWTPQPQDVGINAAGQRVPTASSQTGWLAGGLTVTQAATASTLAQRRAGGALSVGTPTVDSDAATKLYVDTAAGTKVDKSATASIVYGTSDTSVQAPLPYARTVVASSIVQRWGAGTISAAPGVSGTDVANMNQLNLKADLVGGLIPQAQLPAIALTEFLGSSADQAAMLAKVGQRGDWTIRSDRSTTWILTAEPSSTLANWQEMSYPISPVISVAGRTGAITLSQSDIGGLAAYQQSVSDAIVTILQSEVTLADAQTISGIKTFSASPIVPTPTTATQAANKSYVDAVPRLLLAPSLTDASVTGAPVGTFVVVQP